MSFVAIATAASAVIGAAGAIYAGQQQRAAAEYNAQLQRNQAEQERLEQNEREARMNRQNEQQLARGIAIRAAQGMQINSGSSLLRDQEDAEDLALQIAESRRASDNRQRGLRSQARMTVLEGKAAQTASYFQAGASLLRGASQTGQLLETRKARQAELA